MHVRRSNVLFFALGFICAMVFATLLTDYGATRSRGPAPAANASANALSFADVLRCLGDYKLSKADRKALGVPKSMNRRPIRFVDWKNRTIELGRYNTAGKQQIKVARQLLRHNLSEGVVRELHHQSLGGPWALGRDIFDAVRRVVAPQHFFLDAGCGSLRFGVHMIQYLERRRYTGFDIDPLSIDAALRYEVPFHAFGDSKRPRVFAADIEAALDRFEADNVKFDSMLFFKVFMHLHRTYDERKRHALFWRIIRRLRPGGSVLCEKPLFPFLKLAQQFNMRVRDMIVQPSWYTSERNITLFQLGIGLAPRKYPVAQRRAMRVAEEYLVNGDDDDDDERR